MTFEKFNKNSDKEQANGHASQALKKLMNIIKHCPNIDPDLVLYAKDYAKRYHKHQKRSSGEPFYIHAIEVSAILASIMKDQDTIIAALLHDSVEDTRLVLPQIGLIFGSRVKYLVDKLTKLDNGIKKLRLAKNETFNKLIKFKEEDKNISYVKLADRIHNMRTLNYIPSIKKRCKIAKETLQLFVPLAKYYKLSSFEKELKTLANNILNQYEN